MDISLDSVVYNTLLYFPQKIPSQMWQKKNFAHLCLLQHCSQLQNQPRCLAIEEWIKKVEQIHTVCFSIMGKNDTVILSEKWMLWKIIILDEFSQTQINIMFSDIWWFLDFFYRSVKLYLYGIKIKWNWTKGQRELMWGWMEWGKRKGGDGRGKVFNTQLCEYGCLV